MTALRVLVADDSAVIRQMIAMALAVDPSLDIVGTAGNGQIALDLIDTLQPDIITLDVEMPGMDGLATVTAIRSRFPRLPIIMFSSLTERGSMTTIEALSRGASDYVTKPAGLAGPAEAIAYIQAQLLPKIKALCARRQPTARAAFPLPVPAPPPAVRGAVGLVAIGVSTGGPAALGKLIGALPATLSVPVVIVQHMPPIFTKQLAEHLDRHSPLTVREACQGDVLQPGIVLLAPGDCHMRIRRRGQQFVVDISDDPPVNFCRPSVDVLFHSVAEACGAETLGIVLTGMGADGRDGCRALRDRGAEILVQDEASSVVWGMPAAVVEAGLAHQILPLDQIAAAITRQTGVVATPATLTPEARP